MYRIFSMGYCGTLYQLSGSGWVREYGLNFLTLSDVCEWLRHHPSMPVLPNGSVMADSYIAKVQPDGTIIETYSHLNEKVG